MDYSQSFRFLRNTPVQTSEGKVVVSTSKNEYTKGNYETMVFPQHQDGEIDFSRPLPVIESGYTENHERKKKRALRAHRDICQRLDLFARPFIFDPTTKNYRPADN